MLTVYRQTHARNFLKKLIIQNSEPETLCSLMDHQNWDPVIIKKSNPNANKVTTTVPKQHINRTPNAIKMEKTYDPDNPDAEPDVKPVMIDMEFGKQIVAARCAKKMTQKQLAAAINLPVNVINEYERGQGVRNGAYVSKIKNYLGIHK